MKRFFFLGDFESDTGPGVADRMIQKGLGNRENIRFSRRKNKILRIAEMVWGISTADCVCFCSYSRSNLFAFRLCKMLHKKTAYIMHGYMERESKIANADEETLKAVKSYERTVFSASDRLICVSKGFMEYMIQADPRNTIQIMPYLVSSSVQGNPAENIYLPNTLHIIDYQLAMSAKTHLIP